MSIRTFKHFLSFIMCASLYTNPAYGDGQPQKTAKQPDVWITVFVHGIMSIAPHINMRNFALFMKDDIVDTVYARTVNLMRQDQFFHLNQAMQGFGIRECDINGIAPGKAANAIARIYDEMTKKSDVAPTINHYYTYGWSGLLSVSQRYAESEGLLIALHQLIQKYKLLGITPKVRVVGYSHGGNVSLNIAAIHRDKYPMIDLVVDELILIGMPVQVETDRLIESPIFKKVYHIYSRVDRIQRIDFFSYNRFLSDREFKTRRGFRIPEKLTQINLKITRLRTSKRNKKRMRRHARSKTNPANLGGQRRLLRDVSPGHIELWFFGWTPGKYRHYFPLAPLPALATVPYILAEIEKHHETFVNPFPITVDLRPELEEIIIKQRKRNDKVVVVPFVTEKELEELKNIARAIEPASYTNDDYQQHIESALKQARKDYDMQKAQEKPKRIRRRRRRFRRDHNSSEAVDRHVSFLEPIG